MLRFDLKYFVSAVSKLHLRLALLVLLLCSAQLIPAQDYYKKLEWQTQPRSFATYEDKTIKQTTFTNALHLEQFGLLPFYSEIIPLSAPGEVSAQIINAVYSPATQSDNASLSFISETPEVKAELLFYRKQPSAHITFPALRKNAATGAVEKLESFTLRLTVASQRSHRSAHSYAANSVLASGNFYKIAVAADGMYKIDFNFLKNTLKIDPAQVNCNTLAIFGNGGGMVPELNSVARPDDLLENPTMLVDNNSNNRFDDGDYLLFYGQMPDQWKFNSGTQSFTHEKNLYSDKTFYFLTTDAGTGKRVSVSPAAGSANKTITDFDERVFHESDEVNPLSSGKVWLGDKMTSFSNTKSFPFNFPDLITSVPVKFSTRIGAATSGGSSMRVDINGQNVTTLNDGGITSSSYPPAYLAYSSSANYTAVSGQINVTYTFNPASDPSGTAAGYIDWFELALKRTLTLSGDAMMFRNISSVGSGNVSNFLLNNASSSVKVWEVTNIGNIREMQGTLTGSQFSFTTATNELKEFIAFNANASFANPEYIGKAENQNLHSLGQPDMLIVTHPDFESASNELASFHRTYDNLTVSVVRVSQIYNEFGSGKPDISAIRDFVKMFYDRAGGDTAKMPRYLLLMGDATYDPKSRIANNNNFISTYESNESANQLNSFACDDFFGLLDANEGGNLANFNQLLDLGIGRLPVTTETEAWEVVNKIKNYKRPVQDATCNQLNNNASWRNVLTFIADDLDVGGTIFEDQMDQLAEATRSANPVYNFTKIYMDAYKQVSTPAGGRFPEVNSSILNRINSGTLVLNWMGHGGPTNWASERIFNMADIVQLQNKEKLPLFITATCDFGVYDHPDRSAGEWLMINGKGGAIALVTTVRLVYQSGNYDLNSQALKHIFSNYEGRYPTLGEIIMLTKNNVASDVTNMRKFSLLGDPALTLNYPASKIVTTQINNKPITQPHDTLKALSQVTIKGEIKDNNDNKLTSFTGFVFPVVYDKISSFQTLGNDEPSIRSYKAYKNILFKGKASVTNGDFSYTFIVPKDINYQYGNGRISYYADNGNYADAGGFTDSIVIGGSADSFMVDNAGPKMNIYMNDEKFVFGGTTNQNPLLLLKLSDESGINTVGNGIGHDLTATLDDNTQNKVVLNEYYESELDNFQKGAVKYPFAKLTDGRHTLKVKAWDIQNNSSDDYTEFIVASNAKLALSHVYNYPNPFTTNTRFMFELNRTCDDLNVSVQIYTVSGKLVKSLVAQVNTEGFRVDNIEWNGLDDYGDPIGKGVYVYKLNVRDSEGQSAHKFEKLVLLR